MPVVTKLTDAVIAEFDQPPRGVHIDTAIAGCAATAGMLVLREFVDGDTLAKLEPGSVILHDDVHNKAGLVFSFAGSMASSVGIRPTEPGPDRNQPHLTHQELVARIEPIAVKILTTARIPRIEWANHVAAVAVDLVFRSEGLLDSDVFGNIVADGILTGAKTVPLRDHDQHR